jgi:hypothetical protein
MYHVKVGKNALRWINNASTFVNDFLRNTGKLVSISVVVYTIALISITYAGQINNQPAIDYTDSNTVAASLADRRNVYVTAMASVVQPLSIIAGVLPTIIGIGMMVAKFRSVREQKTPSQTAQDQRRRKI